MSTFFTTETRVRCSSVLYQKDSKHLRCSMSSKHEENANQPVHGAFSPTSNLYIRWTEKDAYESKKYLYIKSKIPLIGWRVWHIRDDFNGGGRLFSISAGFPWEGPVMRTQSNRAPNSNFEITNDPGVYCYKTPALMFDNLLVHGTYRAFGSISLSGTVVEHSLGYRAQIATVKELWVIKPSKIEDIYSCPIHEIDSRQVCACVEFYEKEVAEGNYK